MDFSLSDHLVYKINSNLCPDIHIFIGKSISMTYVLLFPPKNLYGSFVCIKGLVSFP